MKEGTPPSQTLPPGEESQRRRLASAGVSQSQKI